MGIEGIISQQFFWCFWASQTLYNGKTLEPELQTQLDNFWTTLEGQACADPGVSTPIGANGNFDCNNLNDKNPSVFNSKVMIHFY